MIENTFKYKFTGNGLTTKEKRWGEDRFNQYCEIYPHLNKLSDLQLLEELVFKEGIQERLKAKVGKLTKSSKMDMADAYSDTIRKKLDGNLDHILILKEKLGMFEDKKKLDVYQDLQTLFDKFKIWRNKNQLSRKCTCPWCSKIFFLMMRTDKYEEKKHPFFEDKVLCNKELHNVYEQGLISKETYAKIIGTSPDYIDWLSKKFFDDRPSGSV